MMKAIIAGFVALPSMLLLLGGSAIAASERPLPLPDIYFLGRQGEIQRGVRCAAQVVNPRRAAALGGTLSGPGGTTTSAAELSTVWSPRTVPVFFHVIYTQKGRNRVGEVSDQQIADQMSVLNAAYTNAGVSFHLAGVERVKNSKWFNGCYNYSTEQDMKQALAIDPTSTLNIYMCDPSNVLGYAYYPWSFPQDSFWHGVVMLYSTVPDGGAAPYDEGDTATHEVGHYLGLYHTFENGCDAPGDEVDDTPAEASPAFGCPEGRDSCPDPGADPINNFMDYVDDFCMDEFTGGQDTRMQDSVIAYKSGLRCGDGACDSEEDSCVCPSDCGDPAAIESLCADSFDDDCNGLTDCADPNCTGDPACAGSCDPSGTPCSTNGQCCSGNCKGKPGSRTCK